MSNVGLGDETFECERGSWNITRAERDCRAGKHPLFEHDVAAVFAMNEGVEVEAAKVETMIAAAELPPIIFVAEDGALWLIDGHHRIHALHRRGVKDCPGYVIAEADAAAYRVLYNGERVAPWRRENVPRETENTRQRPASEDQR